jgi:hypothetical protein
MESFSEAADGDHVVASAYDRAASRVSGPASKAAQGVPILPPIPQLFR